MRWSAARAADVPAARYSSTVANAGMFFTGVLPDGDVVQPRVGPREVDLQPRRGARRFARVELEALQTGHVIVVDPVAVGRVHRARQDAIQAGDGDTLRAVRLRRGQGTANQ